MIRRLPGIRFEAQPPPAGDILPRMDVAVFVGFAASGPLHCPVAVEDPAAFAAIFGADAPLAWDARRGEQVYAYLAPAVRAFLRNGGRRCWVIRVADQAAARADRFLLPGVLRADADPSGGLRLRPAYACARSQGRWADAVHVGTALALQTVLVEELALAADGRQLSLRCAGRLDPGDVLRLRYLDSGLEAVMLVEQVLSGEVAARGALAGRAAQRETRCLGRALWFAPLLPPGLGGEDGLEPAADAVMAALSAAEPASAAALFSPFGERQAGLVGEVSLLAGGAARFSLALGLAEAPAPGELLRLDTQPGPLWLRVESVTETTVAGPAVTGTAAQGEDDPTAVQIIGRGMRLVAPPAVLPPDLPAGERLLLELHARTGSGDPARLSDLQFAPAGERWWGWLPTDAQLFDPDARREREDLRRLAANPRFPLAGSNPEEPQPPAALPLFTFPLGMEALSETLLPATLPPGSPLERDGLAEFRRGLFLDPALADALTGELLQKADFIRYLAAQPRPLRGIHAALAVDEATLIAVPDAAQRPWDAYTPAEPIPPSPAQPVEHPLWRRPCLPQGAGAAQEEGPAPEEAPAQPPWGEFLDCAIEVLDPPRLRLEAPPDPAGTFTLSWSSDPYPGALYILQEATEPNFAGAVTLSQGERTRLTLYGRSPGDYYYRARVLSGINSSDWSAQIEGTASDVVRVGGGAGWAVRQPERWPALSPLEAGGAEAPRADLLSVQRALLRLCAARGDLFAVLALPDDAREDAAIAHAAALRPSDSPIFSPGPDMLDLPVGFGEARALSYGGLYHPWLIARDQNEALRRVPPDGAVCGMLARRALARGAWTAPANERLRDVVALDPPIRRERWLDLQTAQLNLVRGEPGGFLTLSADTLATDAELLPVNVRRLLSLLRRLALRLGADFVFEPNDDSFIRLVRRELESALNTLFTRGAFAGRTPDAAYRVVFRATPQDVDNGRQIVDVMVAPALPMVFLTVRLVQAGGRAVTEEL